MTDQPQTSLGTVAEEAARLIAAMATMARTSAGPSQDSSQDPSPYAGGPAQTSAPRDAGSAPRESGSAPRESGSAPRDAGSAPRESGSAPRESGSAPRESGSAPRDSEHASRPADAAHEAGAPSDEPSPGATAGGGVCSACGGEGGGTPIACKLCPLCQGIALLRSVRPETVDRLADLASAMAASLRDVATQSRASGTASDARSDARSGSGRPSGGGRATVQDIPVDDENEGWRR